MRVKLSGMDRSNRSARHRWALAICWNVAVLLASFGGFSAAHTGSILVAILQVIAPSLDASTVATIHFAIRQLAHFSEYAVLSAFYAHAQRPSGQTVFLLRWSAVAVSICAATAILDEWHQSFVPSRTASPRDVALDISGAVIVQLLWAVLRRRSRSGALES